MAASLPTIIQGGMGAAVSDWRLANAVSSHGQLGVVSGTALDAILALDCTSSMEDFQSIDVDFSMYDTDFGDAPDPGYPG